jgi:hypothetical protein
LWENIQSDRGMEKVAQPDWGIAAQSLWCWCAYGAYGKESIWSCKELLLLFLSSFLAGLLTLASNQFVAIGIVLLDIIFHCSSFSSTVLSSGLFGLSRRSVLQALVLNKSTKKGESHAD